MKEDLTVLKNIVFMALVLFVALTVASGTLIIAKTLMGIKECEVRKEEEQIHVKWTIPFKGTFGE